jgi:hypothetical protein
VNKILIVGFEGFGGTFGRWLYRGLLSKFEKEADVSMHGWFLPRPPEPKGRKLICVSHSFGCSAAHAYAGKHKAFAHLALDPRRPPFGTGGLKANVPTVCFYQTGPMRGYEIEGAENIHLTGIKHTDVPKYLLASARLREMIEEARV